MPRHELADAMGFASPQPGTEPGTLQRRLGVPALVLIIIAFNCPIATMAGFAQLSIGFGNHIGAPLSFLVAGAILLIFSVGFVGMSRFIDNPGAFYLFITAGLGRSPGIAGAFLATGAYVLMCAGSYPYMGLIVVNLLTQLTGEPGLSWKVWSLLLLFTITVIGLFRVDLSMKVLGKLVLLEIFLIAVWEVAILVHGGPEGYARASFAPGSFVQGSVGLGVMLAMMCMIGIEAAACLSAETRNPETAVGRATYIAIVFMAAFYCIGTWCYIVSQGMSHAVHSASTDPVGSFFASVQTYLGTFLMHVASVTLITSQMAATNAIQASASRYLFALGLEGVLPSQLTRVHARLQSPFIAVAVNGILSFTILATILILGVDPVLAYSGLSGMGVYFLVPLLLVTSCSIIVFYRKHPELRASNWERLIAPATAAFAIGVMFVLASLKLKILVGTQTMAFVSIAAMLTFPTTGWLLARSTKERVRRQC